MLLYLRCRDGGADRGARVGTRGPSQGLGPTTLQIGMPRGSVSHESFVSAYNSHALAFIPFPFFSQATALAPSAHAVGRLGKEIEWVAWRWGQTGADMDACLVLKRG